MDQYVSRVGGFVALGVILWWLWKDAAGTGSILYTVGNGSGRLIGAIEGQ
jgi:hypothetical protein